MTLTKLKVALAVVLTLGIVGIGAGGVLQTAEDKKGTPPAASPPVDKPKPEAPAPKVADKAAERATLSLEHRVELMQDKLSKPITLENGIDRNTQLKDAMEFLADRYDVPILIDTTAFKEVNEQEDVEGQPVHLPKMIGVDFRTVLRLLTAQVNGTFRARADYLEIVPGTHSWPEEWVRSSQRHRVPRVSARFQSRPLARAVQELSDLSGVNVVLDVRVAKDAEQTQVTARFDETPVDTAVGVLADMGNLKPVALDNVLYVTSKANAEAIRAERQVLRSPKNDKSKTEPAKKPQEKASTPAGK